MTVVVDDRPLLDVLADRAPEPIAAELTSGGVFTTSSWYYRLGRRRPLDREALRRQREGEASRAPSCVKPIEA